MFLKYLFPVTKINYLILEKYFLRNIVIFFYTQSQNLSSILLTTCMHHFLFVKFKFCLHFTVIFSLGLIFYSQRDIYLFAVVHMFELYQKIFEK